MLRPVERLIGEADDLLFVRTQRPTRRADPEAGRDRSRLVDAGDADAQLLGEPQRGRLVHVAVQDADPPPAEAPDEVGAARAPRQLARDRDQDLVADLMAV